MKKKYLNSWKKFLNENTESAVENQSLNNEIYSIVRNAHYDVYDKIQQLLRNNKDNFNPDLLRHSDSDIFGNIDESQKAMYNFLTKFVEGLKK